MIALLRLPGVARLVVPAVVARVPLSMIYVGLLLFVQRETGSFAIGGAVEASLSVASALSAPLVGRLVDRHGQTLPLVAATLVSTGALVALVVAGRHGAPPLALSCSRR